MRTEELQVLTDKVCVIAKKAGAFIRQEALQFSADKIEYKGLHDMVSYVDKTAEEMIVRDLKMALPGSGFITEENTSTEIHPDYNWIIDPLDGTTNFIHSVPLYAVSIALKYKEELVIGVVYEVNLDECFYAWKEGGAYLNGKRISVTQTMTLSESLIATGFPYSVFDQLQNYMDILREFMYNTHGVRRLGSAAVDLVYVACGRFDGFFEYNLNAWDVAGGSIIVTEAGGKVTDFKNGSDYVFGRQLIASNGLVGKEMLAIIEKYFEV